MHRRVVTSVTRTGNRAMMKMNARWNFDTDRIGSNDADDWRIFDIPVDRSKRAIRSDAIDQSSAQSSTTMRPPHMHTLRLAECVSPLRGANSRRRFAFCSPLREMDRLAEKKLSNVPADPLPFSRSTVSLFLFIYLFIYPFILFLFLFFFFLRSAKRSLSRERSFFQRTCGSLEICAR